MRRRLFFLVMCVGAAAPAVSGAQERALPLVPQSLSLAEATDLAARYNPAHRQVLNDRGPAAWNVRSAYAALLPTFGASASASYTGGGTQRFLTTEFSAGSATLGSTYSIGLNWQLSGSTLMQPGLTKAQLEAAEAQISSSRINLQAAVVEQYLSVLKAEAEVEIAELQLRRNEESLRLARARFDVGQGTMLEVRQAEVAKGQSEVAVLRERQDVVVEKLRIFQLIGIPAPEDPTFVTLSDTFPIVEPTWELSDLLSRADADNPDLGSLRAQEASTRWSHRAAKSTWLPSLSFSAGWSGFTQEFTDSDFAVVQARRSLDGDRLECEFLNEIIDSVNTNLAGPIQTLPCGQLALTPEAEASILAQNQVFPFGPFSTQPFSARLTISVPIWNQFTRPLQVSEAGARADDVREAVRARQLQVRTDVSQAYYALQTAYVTIGMQDNNRTAAHEQLRLATELYRVGSGTFIQLLDAQVAARQAEFDYIRAVYDYHRAIALLESAVGHPLR